MQQTKTILSETMRDVRSEKKLQIPMVIIIQSMPTPAVSNPFLIVFHLLCSRKYLNLQQID